MARGRAEALSEAVGEDGAPASAMLRIHPSQVLSWGLPTGTT
jgi:hypothetical protein